MVRTISSNDPFFIILYVKRYIYPWLKFSEKVTAGKWTKRRQYRRRSYHISIFFFYNPKLVNLLSETYFSGDYPDEYDFQTVNFL